MRERGYELNVIMRSDDSDTVRSLVGAGVGAAIVPQLIVDPGGSLVPLALDDVFGERVLALAWHPERRRTPGARGLHRARAGGLRGRPRCASVRGRVCVEADDELAAVDPRGIAPHAQAGVDRAAARSRCRSPTCARGSARARPRASPGPRRPRPRRRSRPRRSSRAARRGAGSGRRARRTRPRPGRRRPRRPPSSTSRRSPSAGASASGRRTSRSAVAAIQTTAGTGRR